MRRSAASGQKIRTASHTVQATDQFIFVLWRLVFFQNNIQNSKSSRYISTVFGDYSNQMAMTRYQYHK
jgi:hypothetical protein